MARTTTKFRCFLIGLMSAFVGLIIWSLIILLELDLYLKIILFIFLVVFCYAVPCLYFMKDGGFNCKWKMTSDFSWKFRYFFVGVFFPSLIGVFFILENI